MRSQSNRDYDRNHLSSGNPSYLHLSGYGEHATDRGKSLTVCGWNISAVTWGILCAVLGPARAKAHCECLAKRAEA
jgi:hypothetical protein